MSENGELVVCVGEGAGYGVFSECVASFALILGVLGVLWLGMGF